MSTSKVDAESAYRAWLEAAAEAAGSRTALNSEIAKRLPRVSGIDARIRGWTNPNTLKIPLDKPIEETSDAAFFQRVLVDVIAELDVVVPAYSASEKTFSEILHLVNEYRVHNQKHGQKLASVSNDLYVSGSISVPVVAAENLDLGILNLGSAKYQGGIPPYIERDIDQSCLKLLNDSSIDVITLIGAPKVGKTRTLVANLQSSNHRTSDVFWLSPGRAFVELVSVLKPSDKDTTVIVIDDLQRWGSELRELSADTLRSLATCAKILVTVHKSDFTRWQTSRHDHSSRLAISPYGQEALGLNADVISILEKGLLTVDPQLSMSEEALAKTAAPEFAAEDIKNLGSFFSSTEFLEGKLAVLRDSTEPMAVAMVQGLIDTHILFPGGFSVETLKKAVEDALEKKSPQAYFSFSRFEALLADELTRGASETSPHCILQRQHERRDSFFLFDPLWSALKPMTWTAPEVFIRDTDLEDVGLTIAQAGYLEEALRILTENPIVDSASFSSLVGQIYFDLGNTKEAKHWCEVSSKLGDVQGTFLLGFILEEENNDAALGLYEEAAEAGHELAMYNLALKLETTNRQKAEKLYAEAAKRGVAAAAFNLGILNFEDNPHKAVECFQRAGELGSPGAHHNLGVLAEESGNKALAIEHYKRAADEGDQLSMFNLGVILWDESPDEAEFYYRGAVAQGLPSAMLNLGTNLMDSDPIESEKLLNQALNAGHPKAKFALAMLLVDLQPEISNRYLHECAAANDPKALLWLGNELTESDPPKGMDFLERAAELKEPEALYNLAWLLEDVDRDRALDLYRQAAEVGVVDAKFNLAILLSKDDPETAEMYARECVAAGAERGEELLADVLAEAMHKNSESAATKAPNGTKSKTTTQLEPGKQDKSRDNSNVKTPNSKVKKKEAQI